MPKQTQTSDQHVNKDDGLVHLKNPNIKSLDCDYLYHLCLDTKTHDLVEMFGDVKFVCMGGPKDRMKSFAHYLVDKLGDVLPTGTAVQEFEERSYRFSMYKVGPVISINHGMGSPSTQILLNEMIKLMHYAKVKNPVFIRIGSSGGIGVERGTVVVSDGAFNDLLKPYHVQPVCGKAVERPAILNNELARELKELCLESDDFEVVNAKTMGSSDFFEAQGRTDGPFCYHNEDDRLQFLKHIYELGVRNIEMEAACFAAVTHLAGIKAAIVCATYTNRFDGDQISPPKSLIKQWDLRAQEIVARYIRRQLS